MRKLFYLVMVLGTVTTTGVQAQDLPGLCYGYGGIAEDGTYWKLLDNKGQPLEEGDWVYAAWAGPDRKINPPDERGYPTGDDEMCYASGGEIAYGVFTLWITIWNPGTVDSLGRQQRPTDGDLIYCRLFDGPEGSIDTRNYYSDSQLHECKSIMGDKLYCIFPGDPGAGCTVTPIQVEESVKRQIHQQIAPDCDLRLIYPNPLDPVVEMEYYISSDSHVIIKVFDLEGLLIATLVDDDKKAGLYTERWDVSDRDSGIYLCKLRVGECRKTMKMVYLQ